MEETIDILVFGAHPDDAEIGMGATIAKHVRHGNKVVICDLTEAEMSSNGTVELRRQEAQDAAKVLGLSGRVNLQLPDRGLFVNQEQIDLIVEVIRKYRPRIVFAPYWQDRHPDHITCSYLVQEAVFNAKLRNYMPHLPAVAVEQTYFYFINDVYEASVMVEVTEDYEAKRAALRAYRTQFTTVSNMTDAVKTPLNQGYLERVEARDKLLGQKHLVEFAEGFVSKLPFRVGLFT